MFLIKGPPPFHPARCLVTYRGATEDWYVDLGKDFDFEDVGRQYVHWSAVKDMYQLLLTDPELRELLGEDDKDRLLREKDEEVIALHQALDEANAKLDAVHVLKNSNAFKAQKKPGRKPTKTKETVNSGS